MPELPEYMYQKERQIDPIFLPEEFLYRRVKKDVWGENDMWDDEDIDLDCIEFPDMSVSRQKYGPPEAVRWERGNLVDWGVIGFRTGDIPAAIPFQGAFYYRLRAVHAPDRRNYPHSEVRVFESRWDRPDDETHIGKTAMPGITLAAQQEWRELVRRKCQIVLHPGENGEAR